MSDPRMQEIAERAQAAARRTEFTELSRRGRRRRAGGVLAAAAATALVLGGTAIGVHGAYDDSSAPAHPVAPTPTVRTATRTSSPNTTPACGSTYDCQLKTLLQKIGIKHPSGDHGYRGAILSGLFQGRDLQVATSESQLPPPSGHREGSVVVAGTPVDVYSDAQGQRAQFVFDGLRYQVRSFPTACCGGASSRAGSLSAARAMLAVLRPSAPTAEEIVNDPHADLTKVAIADGDSRVRAAVWGRCLSKACTSHEYAVAVTADAFVHTASYVRVSDPTALTWAGDGLFVISGQDGALSLVDPSGAVTPLSVSQQVAPLGSDETLVTTWEGSALTPYGVSAARRTAHPLPLPGDHTQITSLTRQGQALLGLGAGTTSIVSSPDGGASWRAPYRLPDRLLHGTVASSDPNTLAVIDLADDGVTFPALHRSRDGGASWEVVKPAQLRGHFAAWAVVEPSGGLLIYILDPTNVHTAPDPGLYESDDVNWTHFHALASSPPLHGAVPSPNDGGQLLAATTNGQSIQTLFLADGGYLGSEPAGDLVSTDDGRTWTATRYR